MLCSGRGVLVEGSHRLQDASWGGCGRDAFTSVAKCRTSPMSTIESVDGGNFTPPTCFAPNAPSNANPATPV